MKDISKRCIFSGSTENLNTIMEISLDGEKYKIAVSDEHEDDATPSAIRELIPQRLEELDKEKEKRREKFEQFRELAEEFGFDLVQKGGLLLAQTPDAPAADAAPQVSRAAPDPEALKNKPTVQVGEKKFKMQKNTRAARNNDDGLNEEEAHAALEAAKRNSQKYEGNESPTPRQAPRLPSHQMPDAVTVRTWQGEKTVERPETISKKLQTVKGRAGIPTTIPRNLQGTDGETTITIVDTGGDRTIQARGKDLARMREQGDETYYQQHCRPCQGTGFHAKKQCKTCGGVGFLI